MVAESTLEVIAAATSVDPAQSAQIAGLRYVTADGPGIRRQKRGRGWVFLRPDGSPVKDKAELQRIAALVIPPAWNNVWICPDPHGHLQAVGIDQRGRKQYRYHAEYRATRDATKFTRMLAFGEALPGVRKKVASDLQLRGLPREKVVATVIHLLETTSVRIGNEEYARSNASFGLTTLRDHHVEFEGPRMRFQFRGKSGREHEVEVSDRRVARIVQACQDIPGQELFQYLGEDGKPCKLCSEDVNRYLKEVTGADFTAKDFRTWNGSREALSVLRCIGPGQSPTDTKRKITAAVKQVAECLGNRPATCRKYYVHPALLSAYEDGSLFEIAERAQAAGTSPWDLSREEVAVMEIVSRSLPARVRRTNRARRRAA